MSLRNLGYNTAAAMEIIEAINILMNYGLITKIPPANVNNNFPAIAQNLVSNNHNSNNNSSNNNSNHNGYMNHSNHHDNRNNNNNNNYMHQHQNQQHYQSHNNNHHYNNNTNNNNNSNSNQNNYSNNETLLISKDYIEYSEVNNSIGSSIYGQITPIILQSIRIILAMFVLTGINMLNVIEFRKRYSNRSETSQYITESIYIYMILEN